MYSRAAQEQFVKSKLCQDDPKLYELFQRATTPRATETDRRAFRKKLGKADVSEAVQTFMTNEVRPLVYRAIKILDAYMRPMGEMIITGGDAFNTYFPKDARVVTTDIDTKFCPVFKGSESTVLSPMQQPDFFEALQITKILMWDRLGRLTQQFNGAFNARMRRLARSPIGKLLQIVPVKSPLRRRFTLIHKKKQGAGSAVKEGDVLIDVELFAMDAKIKYLGQVRNIGGMLDIAFMRPMEIGYDVLFTQKRLPNGIKVAGKEFLVTDLYMMQTLKLRPQKAEKDRTRMYMFATRVLGLKIDPKASMRTIFLKSIPRARQKLFINLIRHPVFNRNALLRRALQVNMKRYPTNESFSSLGKCTSNAPRRGYSQTKSDYVFVEDTHKWMTKNAGLEHLKFGSVNQKNANWYIRNMAKYRGGGNREASSASAWKWGSSTKKSCKPTLYGFNPVRNAAIPKKLIQKAMQL